jgi:hypothetical protein
MKRLKTLRHQIPGCQCKSFGLRMFKYAIQLLVYHSHPGCSPCLLFIDEVMAEPVPHTCKLPVLQLLGLPFSLTHHHNDLVELLFQFEDPRSKGSCGRQDLFSPRVSVYLGILGYFKYYNFFVTSFIAAFQSFGFVPHVQVLNFICRLESVFSPSRSSGIS